MKLLRPVCFVLMPFGIKKDPSGGPDIDFDRIYEEGVRLSIEAAELEPIRADEERVGGIIHKPMFERLLLCDFAVADLTTANANVFYELGIRHAVRPATTFSIFARHQALPFDISFLRALPYSLGKDNRFTSREAAALRSSLTRRLIELRESQPSNEIDSPLFQLLPDYIAPDIARLKTDLFRDQMKYSSEIKSRLAQARNRRDKEALRSEANVLDTDNTDVGVLVDLFLSYRALSMWKEMIEYYDTLPSTIKNSVMMREQYGLALNRFNRRDDAADVLQKVVDEHGPSSEICGILGRVYKDRWLETVRDGNTFLSIGFLDKAINTYLQGFEADWRDAYPGINAITLLEIRGDGTSLERKAEILPVVRYAVNQRLKTGAPDYWDHATLLELAVLDNDQQQAAQHLNNALAEVRELWEPETTAKNLRMIRNARQDRGESTPWLDDIIDALDSHAQP
jgi:tetratricopeptide (TPR) repeat protein